MPASARRQRSKKTIDDYLLSEHQLEEMYRTMLLARRLNERMLALNRQGRAPFFIGGTGQEAAQVGGGMVEWTKKDPLTFIMGEDVESGGVFRATDGLSATYPGRLIDSPWRNPRSLGSASALRTTANIRPRRSSSPTSSIQHSTTERSTAARPVHS